MNKIIEIVVLSAGVYVTVAFAKFMLVASSAHIAAGVYTRLGNRAGMPTEFLRCYIAIMMTQILVCLIHWPSALWSEKFRFFRLYSRREVIQDVVRDWRFRFN